ncbi:MAG: hypothetical protein RLZ59_779, partial [Pseudomonadota bacterium]
MLILLALISGLVPALFAAPQGNALPGNTSFLMPLLLFNAALILFGWRHYRALRAQVADRARAAARARTLAMRDPLTGFHNRRSLAESGAEALAHAAHRGRAMAMLLLDVDHFK